MRAAFGLAEGTGLYFNMIMLHSPLSNVWIHSRNIFFAWFVWNMLIEQFKLAMAEYFTHTKSSRHSSNENSVDTIRDESDDLWFGKKILFPNAFILSMAGHFSMATTFQTIFPFLNSIFCVRQKYDRWHRRMNHVHPQQPEKFSKIWNPANECRKWRINDEIHALINSHCSLTVRIESHKSQFWLSQTKRKHIFVSLSTDIRAPWNGIGMAQNPISLIDFLQIGQIFWTALWIIFLPFFYSELIRWCDGCHWWFPPFTFTINQNPFARLTTIPLIHSRECVFVCPSMCEKALSIH